jgi:predicted negative regulator of RcsB-dependent stress response
MLAQRTIFRLTGGNAVTRKNLFSILLAAAVALPATRFSHAQAQSNTAPAQNSVDQDVDLLRKDVRSQKKQLIAANVPLTDAEAQKFWPVYDQYTADLVAINNDKYQLIKEYAQGYNTMTDAQADDWTQRLLKLDANVAGLRQKYWSNFRKVLPAKKTALYEQVERRAQMLIDLQISSQIPLAQP